MYTRRPVTLQAKTSKKLNCHLLKTTPKERLPILVKIACRAEALVSRPATAEAEVVLGYAVWRHQKHMIVSCQNNLHCKPSTARASPEGRRASTRGNRLSLINLLQYNVLLCQPFSWMQAHCSLLCCPA